MGYEQQDELRFPAKKLRALWFSPPKWLLESEGGDGVGGPLPRIFISELLVDQLSPHAQVHLFSGVIYIYHYSKRLHTEAQLVCVVMPKIDLGLCEPLE
jgi:hypothetical protein